MLWDQHEPGPELKTHSNGVFPFLAANLPVHTPSWPALHHTGRPTAAHCSAMERGQQLQISLHGQHSSSCFNGCWHSTNPSGLPSIRLHTILNSHGYYRHIGYCTPELNMPCSWSQRITTGVIYLPWWFVTQTHFLQASAVFCFSTVSWYDRFMLLKGKKKCCHD